MMRRINSTMNIQKLRNYLIENKYDGILLKKRNNFSWITGGQKNHIVLSVEEGVADLVVFQDKVILITSKMEERRVVEEECSQLPFEIEVVSDDWFLGTEHLIDRVINGKIIVSDSHYKSLKNVESELKNLRSVLNESEITRYRELCKKAAHAVESTCKEIQPGQTEFEISALLFQKVISQGINVSVSLVATDDRIYNYRHPIPTNKKLEKHAMIVVCAEEGGLVANVTRLVYFGELPQQLKENKERVARIDSVMNNQTKAGVKISEVVSAGIKQYKGEGFPDDWKLLHQGGLTGFAPREYLATLESEETIRAGQAFAWNPALPGVKSEDTVLVHEDGIEFLTHTGEWVYQSIEINGKQFFRPDILVR
jgi:Xaa-Pro dipeptidase